MKKTIIATTFGLLLTSQAFSADCKLRASVYEGFNCVSISTKFKVTDQVDCENLVESAKANRFFNTMNDGDKLLAIKMTYKSKKPSVKVVKKFDYLDSEEYCY